MPVIKIKSNHFSAASKVYALQGDGLTPALRGALQSIARIAASSVTALTDNSGGAAADGAINAIPDFTPAVLGSTDAAQKAGLETGFGTVVDALKELIAQANALNAKVPALDGTLVDSIIGTAADGTIGAITVSYTGVNTSMASAAGANTFLGSVRDRIAQLRYHVNKLCVACGVDPLVDASGGTASYGLEFAAVSTSTGTAASGADTTSANAIIKATDANTKVANVAAAVKEIATKLNACRSATGGVVSVVAA